MPLREMRKNAAKWAPEYTPLRQELILNATKISVDMIEMQSSDIMKGMPKGTRFAAEQSMKYVLWRERRYFKDTEQAIERGEDRLNLYNKGLQSGYNDDAGEIVAGYGRYTLRSMQKIAERHEFGIVSGGADSLFLLQENNDNSNEERLHKFILECNQRLDIEVEHQATFSKFLSTGKKKHYIGIDSKTGEPVVRGIEGLRNDRAQWINDAFDRFVHDFINGADPILNIKQAVTELESGQVDPEHLKIRVKLSKNPEDYTGNHPNKKIGLQLGRKAGELIWYYKTDGGVSLNSGEISIKKYKEVLMAAVKDALEVMGYGSTRFRDFRA
jgi:DNA polymerase elongation subunit (family B)